MLGQQHGGAVNLSAAQPIQRAVRVGERMRLDHRPDGDARREREKLFEDAVKILEKNTPMDVVLLPMKGDTLAAHAFWRLARKTKGSYVIPSRDWP